MKVMLLLCLLGITCSYASKNKLIKNPDDDVIDVRALEHFVGGFDKETQQKDAPIVLPQNFSLVRKENQERWLRHPSPDRISVEKNVAPLPCAERKLDDIDDEELLSPVEKITSSVAQGAAVLSHIMQREYDRSPQLDDDDNTHLVKRVCRDDVPLPSPCVINLKSKLDNTHKCPECGKNFTRSSNMQRHLLTICKHN